MKGFWHSLLGIKGEDKPNRAGRFIARIVDATEDNPLYREDECIANQRDQLRFQRIKLLQEKCTNWDAIHELECQEKQLLDQTEVVNLDALFGDRTGRQWKRR